MIRAVDTTVTGQSGNAGGSPGTPAAAADLQQQAKAFQGLLGGQDSPGTDAEPAAGTEAMAPQPQALPWPAPAGLMQRQSGQGQLPSGPFPEDSAATAVAVTEPSEEMPTMTAAGFQLWRRWQDERLENQVQDPALPAPAITAGDPAAAAAAPQGDPEATFAALVEKHVRQLLVSMPQPDGNAGASVQICLSEAVLPGTTLKLSRQQSGWQLQVQSADPSSIQALRRFAPGLVARFARQRLGSLDVVV